MNADSLSFETVVIKVENCDKVRGLVFMKSADMTVHRIQQMFIEKKIF